MGTGCLVVCLCDGSVHIYRAYSRSTSDTTRVSAFNAVPSSYTSQYAPVQNCVFNMQAFGATKLHACACVGGDRQVFAWDLTTERMEQTVTLPLLSTPSAPRTTPDLSPSKHYHTKHSRKQPTPPTPAPIRTTHLDASNDGNTLIAATSDGHVSILDVRAPSQAAVTTTAAHASALAGLAYQPGKQTHTLVTGSVGGEMKWFDLRACKGGVLSGGEACVARRMVGEGKGAGGGKKEMAALTGHMHAKLVASGWGNNVVQLWDLEGGLQDSSVGIKGGGGGWGS